MNSRSTHWRDVGAIVLLLLLTFMVERSADGLVVVAAPARHPNLTVGKGSLLPSFAFKNKRTTVSGALPAVSSAVVAEADDASQDWGLGVGFDFGTRWGLGSR